MIKYVAQIKKFFSFSSKILKALLVEELIDLGTKSILKIVLLLILAFIIYTVYYSTVYYLFPDFAKNLEKTFVYSFIPVIFAVISSFFAYKKNLLENIKT